MKLLPVDIANAAVEAVDMYDDGKPYILDGHTHITSRWTGSGRSARDLLADMATASVAGAAVVTPGTAGWDNTLTFDAVASDPRIFTAIARVDLTATDALSSLKYAIACGARGIRITLASGHHAGWLIDGSIDAICRILDSEATVVEFHCGPGDFELVTAFAHRYPGVRVLLDHLGRPDPMAGVAGPAFEQFLRLAELTSIHTKTANSAFFSRQQEPYADLAPFLEAALDAFGAHRIMWSSDWPLCREGGPYAAALRPTIDVLSSRSVSERDMVLHGTFESLLRDQ